MCSRAYFSVKQKKLHCKQTADPDGLLSAHAVSIFTISRIAILKSEMAAMYGIFFFTILSLFYYDIRKLILQY